MRILLTRHGQSTGNLLKILQGQGDFPLTVQGKDESIKLGEEIRDKFTPIDNIYSSDLPRAKETTEIISTILGINSVTYDMRLREHDCGFLQGEVFKEEYKIEYLDPLFADHDFRIPEGESINEMKQRVNEVFNEIVTKSKEKESILIVTHGGVLSRLLKQILNLLPEKAVFENCCINIIERKTQNNSWQLTYFNNEKL
jgi:2,3-bisphosphoglycerate-dependent phosphoglycerate mutase